MLPEGAHNREQDWTYMLLNRNERQLDEVGVPPPLPHSPASSLFLTGLIVLLDRALSGIRCRDRGPLQTPSLWNQFSI
jgi:hypothetical protein